MSELAVPEEPTRTKTPTAKAVPPSVHPVKDRWAIRAAVLGMVSLLLVALVMLAPGLRAWLPLIVAGLGLVQVGIVVIGVRTNRRRELLALLTTQLQVKMLFPLRIVRVRWHSLWAAAPAKITLRYPLRIRHSVGPDLLANQLGTACSDLLGLRYVPHRHTGRGHLTLVQRLAEVTETSELNEIRQRIREVVRQLLGKDATVAGITTDEAGTAVTAFSVRHSAGVKLANQLFQIKVTRIMSAMLPGKWRAHFDLETDEARFRLRPPLPTFIPRPVLPCEPGTPAYFELPQAVDEDGTMQVWDISGVMAHTLKVGRTRTGKALGASTEIPTPSGWTRMGDLVVGSTIFDDTGKPTTVTGVYDQPPNRPCYAVTFSDGSTIVTDEEHLWLTEDRAARISQRSADLQEPHKTRQPRLSAAQTARLRAAAARASTEQVITLRDAAPLTGLVVTHPWLRRIARRVGPCGSQVGYHSSTYRDQVVTQTKTVKVYQASEVYAELLARATSGKFPALQRHASALTTLASAPRTAELTATELAAQLNSPYWQACRWLALSGVPHQLQMRMVELRVAAKTVRRASQAAQTYPKAALLTALAEAGDQAIRDQRYKTTTGMVRTTGEIRDSLQTASGHLNHSVALAGPLDLPEASLPIGPFTLGCWLGDGCSWNGTITSADPELLEHIGAEGYEYRLHRSSVRTDTRCRNYTIIGIMSQLRSLGLLPRKRIPLLYLRASIEQRRALLAGLLDTDGTVSPQGTVQFTSVLPGLAEDVLELVVSLGYRATRAGGVARLNGRDCGPEWTIAFTTTDPVFRLQRKLKSLKSRGARHNPQRTRNRYVKSVDPVPSRPLRCISVDSPSRLFLAGRSMIPTHNTVSLIGDAVEAARRGFRVIVVDPKRVEFLGLRGWPNVEIVATTVQDQIAVLHHTLQLMQERYRQVEEEGAREVDFERVLLIIDEYRQFYANVKGWWASIKVTGMPAECPVFEWVGSLLRMAGACGIHVDLGTQRPDAEFLKGEALALDTPIPTPTGWCPMGELGLGDMVFSEHGKPIAVTAVTAVQTDRPCYRVTFSDRSSIVADQNHRWTVLSAAQRQSDAAARVNLTRGELYPHHADLARRLSALATTGPAITVSELEEEVGQGRIAILRRALNDGRWDLQPRGIKVGQQGRYSARSYVRSDLLAALQAELAAPAPTWRRMGPDTVTTEQLAATMRQQGEGVTWSIPLAGPLNLPELALPIDAWLLGYWLGDGARGAATIATADDEVLERIRALGYRVTHYARYNYGISTGGRGGWRRPSLQRSLREQNLLHNKHVPPRYLRASKRQRADLLAGLLDADGSCAVRDRGTPSGQVYFSNTNRRLIDAVHELAASLGLSPTVRQIRRAGWETHPSSVAFGRPVKDAWVVSFTARFQVFGIRRKQQKLEPALVDQPIARRQRYIVSVEQIDSVPVRCITVDSPSHLYLAGRSFIATHNCRDNFSARMSTGRLSPDGAQMMYDTQHIGTTVPLNVRGRATMIGTDDVPREVQVYYTPDPRRATSAEDLKLLEDLKPGCVTYLRQRVVLGDADVARADLAGAAEDSGSKPKKTQPTADEWLEVLHAQLAPWTANTDGVQAVEHHPVEDLNNEQLEEDPYADYEPAEVVRARRIRPDMLLQIDPDRWVCVTAVDSTEDDDAELQLVAWRDDDDNEGGQELGSFELVEVRRPSPAGGTSR